VLAAVVGGLAPFCSCEIIPFIAALLAMGVPLSAVMALWLSSPLMDPAMFSITASALGVDFAIGKTLAAISLGIGGGFAVGPAYLNGYAAAPLLATLIDQGMVPGAAMSFALAGGVSCIPAAVAVWALVKPRVFALYIALGFAGSVIAGIAWNAWTASGAAAT